jgi:hypothetical protein
MKQLKAPASDEAYERTKATAAHIYGRSQIGYGSRTDQTGSHRFGCLVRVGVGMSNLVQQLRIVDINLVDIALRYDNHTINKIWHSLRGNRFDFALQSFTFETRDLFDHHRRLLTACAGSHKIKEVFVLFACLVKPVEANLITQVGKIGFD